jgi:hypothetical protein
MEEGCLMKMPPFRYSTIQDFYKCPTYYKHKHVDGIPDPGMDKSADMRFGSAIHLGIQDLFEGGNGLDVFNMWWSLEEANNLDFTRLKHGELGKIGQELIAIFRDEHMRHFEFEHLEKKLVSPLGDHVYSGTIDFVGKYKGVKSVVDWKTSAMPYGRHKIEVNEQLYGYAYLAEKELGFKATQIVYGVAVKDPKNPRWQIRTEPLSEEAMKDKLDNLQAICNNISSINKFTKNPTQCAVGSGYSVRVCPYYNRCHKKGQDGEEGDK